MKAFHARDNARRTTVTIHDGVTLDTAAAAACEVNELMFGGVLRVLRA